MRCCVREGRSGEWVTKCAFASNGKKTAHLKLSGPLSFISPTVLSAPFLRGRRQYPPRTTRTARPRAGLAQRRRRHARPRRGERACGGEPRSVGAPSRLENKYLPIFLAKSSRCCAGDPTLIRRPSPPPPHTPLASLAIRPLQQPNPRREGPPSRLGAAPRSCLRCWSRRLPSPAPVGRHMRWQGAFHLLVLTLFCSQNTSRRMTTSIWSCVG